MGFFDLSDRYARLDAKKDPLIGINAVVPWGAFRHLLERVGRKPNEAPGQGGWERPYLDSLEINGIAIALQKVGNKC